MQESNQTYYEFYVRLERLFSYSQASVKAQILCPCTIKIDLYYYSRRKFYTINNMKFYNVTAAVKVNNGRNTHA